MDVRRRRSPSTRDTATADALEQFHPEDPPAMSWFLEAFRALVGSRATLAAGAEPDGGAFAMSFGFTAGMNGDGPRALEELDQWARSGPVRYALYSPVSPEPSQRNVRPRRARSSGSPRRGRRRRSR